MGKPDYSTLLPGQGGRCPSWSAFGIYAYQPAPGVQTERLFLEAEDGGISEGFLYRRGGEKTVVCLMHPRGDFTAHYLLPTLTAAGYAVLGQRSRYFNHDTACVHEVASLDVGAAIAAMRARGFEHVVLVGNSGGGSLFSLYQAQATLRPPHRLTHTAAGDLYDLNALEIPAADALVLLAAHPGEGKFLMGTIDPSVTDEDDPLSYDPELDMYHPENGFRPLPEDSRYEQSFLDRYRQAQRERVARIDAMARQWVASRRACQSMAQAGDFSTRPLATQTEILRAARQSQFLRVHRTEADPRFCDRSIQPSERLIGSLLGKRPDLVNYQIGGFGSVMTPEGWLSTWSGLSSHGSVLDNLKIVNVPLHIIFFTGDVCIFREDVREFLREAGSEDKTLCELEGDHYGVMPDGSTSPRQKAGEDLVAWLQPRFPPRQ